MIRALALLAALVTASAAAAQPAAVTTPLKSLDATSAGQPIVMPAGPLRVTVSETLIPAHGALPVHKHPYPRYVYVLAGRVRVTNLVTGQAAELKAGDMTIDPIDQWHRAEALGDEPVRLIAIDQAPPGAPTTVRREP
ncbi:cupin domain-containing protein [Phenylobacterium sp.]|uniref:cupin domain-containing protein n=1 Tax=Phenylobacterium sp. TaxID=1871053 RepID=UPI002DE807BE|nr:cupin domain-containing protein [Phenylobacterium sp.]